MISIKIDRRDYKEIIGWNVTHRLPTAENITTEYILELYEELPEKVKNRFEAKGNFNEKRIANAKKTYLKGLDSDEELVLFFDTSMFGSGKSGIAITNKKIYTNDGDPIYLNEIIDVLILHKDDVESRIGLATRDKEQEYFFYILTEMNVVILNFFMALLYT